ncbi:MAG: YggS family pyridoxal phosphate-dependent enzyme [Steroidobacteraceae bacterium]
MLSNPQNSPPVGDFAARYRDVQQRIAKAAAAAGRDVRSITLLAVTKGQDVAGIRAALAAGLTQLGENYLDEALTKIAALQDTAAQWHFIGRLQANKTRLIAGTFSWVHSVDRLRTAERLAAQRPPHLPALNVCVQVRVANDPAKGGVDRDAALALLHAINALPRLQLRGLMCMLPDASPEDRQHQAFAAMRALLEQGCQQGLALDTLSMGMSADMDAAIIEGATIVRVGTALFGSRAP